MRTVSTTMRGERWMMARSTPSWLAWTHLPEAFEGGEQEQDFFEAIYDGDAGDADDDTALEDLDGQSPDSLCAM